MIKYQHWEVWIMSKCSREKNIWIKSQTLKMPYNENNMK